MALDIIWHPSPNFGDRPEGARPDMLVLHYTGMKTGAAALDRMCDPIAAVSAHYMVEEDGRVFQLVADEKRAWHAGISCWQGESGLNDVSIGIEIVNPGHEFGYQAFPAEQMNAVEALSVELVSRWNIRPQRVIGHSDIAPDRKQDPGELFDWARLARAGVGIYPTKQPSAIAPFADREVQDEERFIAARDLLVAVGYNTAAIACSADDLEVYVTAFQRHWLPSHLNGAVDETTMAMMVVVAACMAQA